jgi:capsular polysaccharide biosynthesis protein
MNYNAVQKDNGKIMLDLRPLILALIKRAWKIALVTIACALIAFAGAKAIVTPMYRASFQAYASINSQTEKKTLEPMLKLATSDEVLQTADSRIDATYSVSELKKFVSASVSDDDNGLMTVSVTMADPEEAYIVAQTIRDNMRTQVSFTISNGVLELLDEPTQPTKPYSPDFGRYALFGAGIGFFLTVLYILIKELFDRRVNKMSELEKQYDLPILGIIPSERAE